MSTEQCYHMVVLAKSIGISNGHGVSSVSVTLNIGSQQVKRIDIEDLD